MTRNKFLWTVPALTLALLVTGCTNHTKERIALLEQTNNDLTERLNLSQGELEAAYYERDDLRERLDAALRDAENLRIQLAAVPAAEPAAPGWTAVPGGAMIALEGEILFRPGKTSLRPEARGALDAIVSAVQGEYGNKEVYVFGHTDDRPIKKSGWKDNWQLSTERALAVVRYLQNHGVGSDRMVAGGCGEYRPRVANSSEPNRTRNRRVEIFAIDSQLMAGR